MKLQPPKMSRPVFLALMLPTCSIAGLIAGGYLGGWLRYISVNFDDHSFDYEWAYYIYGGAILGAVIGGATAFAVGMRRQR